MQVRHPDFNLAENNGKHSIDGPPIAGVSSAGSCTLCSDGGSHREPNLTPRDHFPADGVI